MRDELEGKATPEAVLQLLGVDSFPRSNRLAFCCPFHDDRDPSAGFYIDTGLAHCFSCAYTLDVVGFYAKFKDMDRNQAERELERQFGVITYRPPVSKMKIATTRGPAERKLEGIRSVGRLKYSALGELLDKILMAYERRQIDDSTLDKAMKTWYNKVKEATNTCPT